MMKRFALVLFGVLLAVPVLALAAAGPPGGPAPKQLVGTWKTTLTRADIARAANPAHMPTTRNWELVIVNSRYLKYPRALGLRPAGEGGDTVPFAVHAHRLYLQCLVQGAPSKGYGIYAWSVRGKTLRLRLVKEPCRERDLRNRIAILTSEPWKKR